MFAWLKQVLFFVDVESLLLLPWVKAVMDVAMDLGTVEKLLARQKTEDLQTGLD